MHISLPDKFLESLEGTQGYDKESFIAAHQECIPVSIRLHPFKKNDCVDLPILKEVPWCTTGRYLQNRPSFTFDPAWHGGMYYVQEASSMFLHHALESSMKGDSNEKKILDLCAAPGGKSTLLAALFPDGLIVSNEAIRSRLGVLHENTIKWGMPNTVITNEDAASFGNLPGFFDVMVVDAPCSGSGLFRRQPAAASTWSEQQVHHCSMRQKKILTDALPALKEGGLLVYATCSFSKEENEDIVDWICSQEDFTPISIPLKDVWGIVSTWTEKNKCCCYRFYPGLVAGEGFFLAMLRKNYSSTSLCMSSKTSLSELVDKDILKDFIHHEVALRYLNHAKQIKAVSPIVWEYLTTLKTLHITHAGILCGELKPSFTPNHALAVSTIMSPTFPSYSVNKEQAIHYLKKNSLDHIEKKGWLLVKYENCALGWIRSIPNRINNYYPTDWRILK
jgi:16S rRNA C967 or C1407 C5-methylase (RsmB/RsmF family)/NOL1/NOP2/fmu family ribosome biogenesis protein